MPDAAGVRVLGAAAWVVLAFAPGAWIAFGFTAGGISFWARLLTGAMLSPLVLCGEFYAARLLGLSFGATAAGLVVFNLPALYFVWKRARGATPPARGGWMAGACAAVVPALCMMPVLLYAEARIYSPHGWSHADAVYMFARGDLVPEAATLAGMRMSYPVWLPLAAQAVQSYVLDSPPVSSYIWSNLLCLVAVCGFAAGIAKEMGGGTPAQIACGLCLLIGTNPLGYLLMKLAPAGHQVWGDPRYTPWVGKFWLFTPMALGLGMLMAVVYLLVRSDPPTKGLIAVVGMLVLGTGVLYPLLFPPVCALVVVKALIPLLETRRIPWGQWLRWAGVLGIAAAATYIGVRFLTLNREAASPVLLSTPGSAARKALESAIATSLLLAGAAFTFRRSWRSHRSAAAFLAGGALAAYALHAAFTIPFYENEYKFVFAAAMCLAVFPALAVERIWREWPRARALAALAALALLPVGAYAHYSYANWPAPWLYRPEHFEKRPLLDAVRFQLRLNRSEKWAGISSAVLRLTPPDAVLVLHDGAVYHPAFMARSLYVAPEDRLYPGMNLHVDEFDADLRGYGRRILEDRRATLADFFGGDDGRRERALATILTLKRPLAVIADSADSNLQEWLEQRRGAARLYGENGSGLWLIANGDAPGERTAKAAGRGY